MLYNFHLNLHIIYAIILTDRKRNVTILLQIFNFYITLDKNIDFLGIHVINFI